MLDLDVGSAKPRLAIYGVGQYGSLIARLATMAGWTVVAAYNRAGPKVGQDLGDVIGLGRKLGVVIEDCDLASYDNVDADIAVVAQTNVLRLNMDAYKRLLNAGLNVICHGAESYFPYGNDIARAREIDELARQNKVTFTGGGIWDMSRIWSGILAAGPSTELTSMFHSSLTDIAGQAANKLQAAQFGAGDTVEQFELKAPYLLPSLLPYKTIPEQVLSALGYTIVDTRANVEPIILDAPLESAFMERVFSAGTVIGTRTVGEIETKEGVTARCEIELRLFHPGDVEHMFWSVEGMPHTRVRVERSDSAHATAACMLNRIPDVIAAAPGIVPVSKLGPLKPTVLQ